MQPKWTFSKTQTNENKTPLELSYDHVTRYYHLTSSHKFELK